MKAYTPQELSECPKITVAGKEYPIPIFGPRQNRRIVPLINKLRGVTVENLDMEKMDSLYNAIYWALSRAHPDLKEADFLDMDIPVTEAMECIPIILRQTGLTKEMKKKALKAKDLAALLLLPATDPDQVVWYEFAPKDNGTGEEEATTSTGTSSSPGSSPGLE